MAGIKKLVDPRGAFLLGAPAVAEVPAAGGDGGGAAPLPAGLKGEEERAPHVGGAAPGGLRAGLRHREHHGGLRGRHGTAARLGVDGQAMYIYVPDQQVGFTPQEKAEWGAYRGSWGSFSQDLGVAGGRENGTGSKRRSFPD